MYLPLIDGKKRRTGIADSITLRCRCAVPFAYTRIKRHGPTRRDLLFGLIALQAGLISQDQLVGAFGAWSRAKEKTFAETLVERGSIDEESRALLAAMAEKQINLHGGDARRAVSHYLVYSETPRSIPLFPR
jgi:hypothetical protein